MCVTEYTEKIMKYTCNDNDDIVENASEHVKQIPNDITLANICNIPNIIKTYLSNILKIWPLCTNRIGFTLQ